jgi:CRISPR-associated Cas5-like protein
MVGFLCFTLEGPLASWGNIAPGEQRTSWTRPSKSAALGLVAAALGIERTQEARLAALHETLGFAVLAEQPGLPVSEFQTEQRPTAVGLNRFSKTYGRSPATRGESLKVDDIATTISRRSFHIGVRHRIALWAKGGAPEDLNAIADALERNDGYRLSVWWLDSGNAVQSGQVLLGCTAEAVIGTGREVETPPGLSLWAACLPGVAVEPFALEPALAPDGGAVMAGWPPHVEPAAPPGLVTDDAVILLADPFTFPPEALADADGRPTARTVIGALPAMVAA